MPSFKFAIVYILKVQGGDNKLLQNLGESLYKVEITSFSKTWVNPCTRWR